MKLPDWVTSRGVQIVLLGVLGILAVDTVMRLFLRPPTTAAEKTVTLAIGKARPWSADEQRVLTRVLPPCREPAMTGNLNDAVNCWMTEARKVPSPAPQGAASDEAILQALLDRAGYKP